MKRYAVFSFDSYYPSGGWNDFQASYDSVEEAQSHPGRIGQIVDLQTGKIVYGEDYNGD